MDHRDSFAVAKLRRREDRECHPLDRFFLNPNSSLYRLIDRVRLDRDVGGPARVEQSDELRDQVPNDLLLPRGKERDSTLETTKKKKNPSLN